jgi:hypothetical protein
MQIERQLPAAQALARRRRAADRACFDSAFRDAARRGSRFSVFRSGIIHLDRLSR